MKSGCEGAKHWHFTETRWGQGLSTAAFPLENSIPFSKVSYNGAHILVELSYWLLCLIKIQYAGGPVYCLELLFFKLAFLISYLRIGGFVATYRIILFVSMAVIVVNQIVSAFIISFSCHPVSQSRIRCIDPGQLGLTFNRSQDSGIRLYPVLALRLSNSIMVCAPMRCLLRNRANSIQRSQVIRWKSLLAIFELC